MEKRAYESVAVSSRIRLARNFMDYPFPARLLCDPHGEEQAREIVRIVSAQLVRLESFTPYALAGMSEEKCELLAEKHLISRGLIANRRISSALVSKDESISVMVNEEDHIREQYFIDGFDLTRAYERAGGIDDVISHAIPFAYDEKLGYLTACPTNVGTGLRASVMLFLPAVSRRGKMRELAKTLTDRGLTVRGAFGEGSGAEGELFQVSNEVTLGFSEGEILSVVEDAVRFVAERELSERERMKKEEGVALKDSIMRSYGILTHCCRLEMDEMMQRTADLKLGVALGFFADAPSGVAERMREIDKLCVSMRPAGIDRLIGEKLDEAAQSERRAEYTADAIRNMELAQ